MRQDAAERKKRYMEKMAENHDRNVLEPLEPATQVLRKIPAKQVGKIDMPRDGPWEVVEQREKEGTPLPVYVVKDQRGNTLLSHRESLTPFEEPLIPNEAERTPETAERKGKDAPSKKASRGEGPVTRSRSRRDATLSTIATRREPTESAKSDTPIEPTINSITPVVNDAEDRDDAGVANDEAKDNDEGAMYDCVQVGIDAGQFSQMTSSGESSPEFHEAVERPADFLYLVIDPNNDEGVGSRVEEFHDPVEPKIEVPFIMDNVLMRLPQGDEDEDDPVPVPYLFQEQPEESAATSFRTAESSPRSSFRNMVGGDVIPAETIMAEHPSGSTFADLTRASMSSGDDVFSPPLRTGASTNPARSAPPNTPQSRTQTRASDVRNFDSITYADEDDPLFRERSEDRDEGSVTEVTAHVSGELIAKRKTSRDRRPPDRWGK